MTILALWRNWAEGEAGSGLRRGEDLSDKTPYEKHRAI